MLLCQTGSCDNLFVMMAGIPPTLILLLYPPSPSFYLSLPHDLVEFILGQAQVSNLLSLFPSNPANLFFLCLCMWWPGTLLKKKHTHTKGKKRKKKQTIKTNYTSDYKNTGISKWISKCYIKRVACGLIIQNMAHRNTRFKTNYK